MILSSTQKVLPPKQISLFPQSSGYGSVLISGMWQRYSTQRKKRRAIFHGTAISHNASIPRDCLKFMTMAFGYTPQGSSGMSYCNQTPFPPREGWGLGTRLVLALLHVMSNVCQLLAPSTLPTSYRHT